MKSFFFHLLWIFDQLLGTKKFNFSSQRKRLFNNVIGSGRNNNIKEISVIKVEEIGVLNKKKLKEILKDTPLIIRGGFNESPALTKWNWDYLKKTIGDINQSYVDTDKHHFNSGLKPTREIIDNILSAEPSLSILFGDMLNQCPELLKDLKIQEIVDENYFHKSLNNNFQFFIAGKEKETDLHAELGSSLSYQIIGNKEWFLFDPRFSMNVLPDVNWRMYLQSSYYHRTHEVVGSQTGLNILHGEVRPGDILYIPAFFWHCARPLSPSLSISRKWTKLSSFLKHPLLSTIILSSRNPSALTRLPVLRYFSKLHPPEG